MNENLISITGIVVGQVFPNKRYYIWCQESYPGKDGFLTIDTQKPVKIGDWVDVKFTPSEFQEYFPNPKNPNAEQFRTSNYTVLPKWYDTIVDGKSIKIRLELALEENQREIRHKVFGMIYNNRHMLFEAGDYLVTIKRIVPLPSMESVWVMDSVDLLPSDISLIGIVGGSDSNYWYVWTPERPVGSDITIKRGGASLDLGSWVGVTVPRDKLKTDHFLESQKYTVIQQYHPTTVINRTIGLELQCNISFGVIQHPFVGPIINEKYEVARDGFYEIRIVRKKPKMMRNGEKSVWFLDGEPKLLQPSSPVVPPPIVNSPRSIPSRSPSRNRTPRNFEVTGIIVAKSPQYLFVWCKERLPGFDVKIPISENSASLDLTDYIKFTVSEDQMSQFFPSRMPENRMYPEFVFSQYRRVPGQFQTFTSGKNNTTINMKLELKIESPTDGDVSHDFVGLIINDRHISFETSGKYKVTIFRFKKGSFPKSVWYLKERELISSLSASTQSLAASMENLDLAPNLKPILKYSHLQNQRNRLGSQSDTLLFQHNVPSPATLHGPLQDAQHARPIPAPRASLDGNRPQTSSNYSKAIILNIVKKKEGQEDIHVWIFEKLKQGFLNLKVPAERWNLEIGKVFEAEFKEIKGKWKAFEVKPGSVQNLYEIRNIEDIEILVLGKAPAAHPGHVHQKLKVENFGDVLDVYGRIAIDFNTKDHFWIRRSKIDNSRWEWVVVEVLDTNRNNRNGEMR